MLYKKLNKYSLRDEFLSYDRDYFSLDGYQAILDLFEELDSNQELDVISICCDFTEADIEDIRSDYGLSGEEYEDIEEVMYYLNYRTYAIGLDNGNILYQSF